jgi:hypothetical protein
MFKKIFATSLTMILIMASMGFAADNLMKVHSGVILSS